MVRLVQLRFAMVLCMLGELGAAAQAVHAEENVFWKSHKKDTESAEASPVAGVRGLEKADASFSTTARDYASISRLEKTQIDRDELKAFLKAGGLRS